MNSWEEQTKFYKRQKRQTPRCFVARLKRRIEKFFNRNMDHRTLRRWISDSLDEAKECPQKSA